QGVHPGVAAGRGPVDGDHLRPADGERAAVPDGRQGVVRLAEGGRREPMTDIEFTEFRRYTPTADELDFEKQFGIPLPALPPKPDRSPRSTPPEGGRVNDGPRRSN